MQGGSAAGGGDKTFVCRAGVSVTRRLSRVVDSASTSKEWPLDSTRSAEVVLDELAPATTRPATP